MRQLLAMMLATLPLAAIAELRVAPPPVVSPQASPAADRSPAAPVEQGSPPNRPQKMPKAEWLDPDRSEPAGTHYRTFKSQLVGGEVSYLVYLPPDYEANATRRYPVVYWLHGFGGNQRAGAVFVNPLDAAIRAGKAPAMIVVLVNGIAASFYCDSPNGKQPVDSVIIKELIPHVDQTYRTIARREARAVEGFSMGGYGAAHLGFKHPDVFGLVSIMAGALTDSVEWGPLKPPQGGRRKMMLNAEKSYFEANDLATVIRGNADAIRGKAKVRMTVGSEDSLRPNNQALHEFLGQLKIEHDYEVVPGVGHDPRLVYGKLGERVLAWYLKAWSPAVQTFTYKTVKGCEIKADVYGAELGAKKPAVMRIHGGALMGGSRSGSQDNPNPGSIAANLVELGFVAVSIDYRLAPETKVREIIQDVLDAWKWVRGEGPKRFGIDPDRIATTGESAGGYLTLMSGFCLEPRPRALVSICGYGDIDGKWLSEPSEFYRQKPPVSKEDAYQGIGESIVSQRSRQSRQGPVYLYCRQNGIWPNEISGHDPHTEPRWFDPYCPVRNVTAKYPPTMLIHGTQDTDVPYAESADMAARLKEAGVEHELITLEDAGHMLVGGKPGDYDQAIRRAVEFIKAHTN